MIAARAACLALALTGLGACDALNADLAGHDWHPEGTNAANLAVMVQNPADLVRGRGDPGPDRKLSAHAVTELWANPTLPFPTAGGAAGGATPGGDTAGGSTGAGGGSGGGGAGSAPGN